MKFEKGTPEYIEFRRKANIRSRRYDRKPEVKTRKKIYKKKYDQDNKEKISEYGKKLRARPEYQERVKKWRKDNKEHLREYARRPENRKRKRISDKKYYSKRRKDKDKVKIDIERLRNFRKNNPEKIKEYNSRYYKSPKGIISYNNHNHRRLAKIKGSETDLTIKKVKKIFDRDKVCVYCSSDKKLELEHIVPLAKGGSCLFINFVVACKKCNCSKSNKDVFYWCKLQGISVPKIVLELLERQKQT